MTQKIAPFDFRKWIDDNRDKLKPPVGNIEVFPEGEMIVMVVGGPNGRKDYHYNETPEFFFQMEGDITVKIIDDGEFRDIHIKECEIFLLPGKIPHSPQRPANTVGLVIEQRRPEGMKDALEWYCENCQHQLWRTEFKMNDIVKELPVAMNAFFSDEEKRTCDNCGTVMEKP
ncbi:MAG: 3-hydroxyanthranilate 3,4-dioxygenase [Candidatus Kapaibacteriales bacterium]